MGDKIKSIIGYLLYLIILGVVISVGLKHQSNLYKQSGITYDLFDYYKFQTLFPLIIGAILSIPYNIKNFLKQGAWKFNWVRFIVLGIPTLYFVITPYLFLKQIISMKFTLIKYIMGGYFGNSTSTLIATIGIAAGYFVFTCFEKQSTNGSVNNNYFN
ncbi:hypothetical protein [Gottfriedia solisilvae]|uniref:Uncharacterized protein n=1 Tax=Gottfriedia solisilvae TaxID=1516104 RepID=A0A8J3EVB5_9BACI|nr:hypothetical protein [Gottfriedia solisilvae]GGI12905.1 hypothetical protein GCM10007380_15250 [Gottfriedia solisilvae]